MARRRKRAAQPKLRSTTQRRGSSTKPRLASGSLTTSSGDAVLKAGKQIAQRIDGQMNFRALLALGPVLAGVGAAGARPLAMSSKPSAPLRAAQTSMVSSSLRRCRVCWAAAPVLEIAMAPWPFIT